MQSYHQAVARRLQAITDKQLEITDIYSLLDWLHNIYSRYRRRRCAEDRVVVGGSKPGVCVFQRRAGHGVHHQPLQSLPAQPAAAR